MRDMNLKGEDSEIIYEDNNTWFDEAGQRKVRAFLLKKKRKKQIFFLVLPTFDLFKFQIQKLIISWIVIKLQKLDHHQR